jgi:hypothetical protein
MLYILKEKEEAAKNLKLLMAYNIAHNINENEEVTNIPQIVNENEEVKNNPQIVNENEEAKNIPQNMDITLPKVIPKPKPPRIDSL